MTDKTLMVITEREGLVGKEGAPEGRVLNFLCDVV